MKSVQRKCLATNFKGGHTMMDQYYWRDTLSFLPELLLALLVLLIGFFVAKLLENLTYKGYEKLVSMSA